MKISANLIRIASKNINSIKKILEERITSFIETIINIESAYKTEQKESSLQITNYPERSFNSEHSGDVRHDSIDQNPADSDYSEYGALRDTPDQPIQQKYKITPIPLIGELERPEES